jgi:sigma-B regulation protein RsbU (phosphoserine phosphatase)
VGSPDSKDRLMVGRGAGDGARTTAGWSLRRRVQVLLSIVVVVVIAAAAALSVTVVSLRHAEDRQQHQLSPATVELGRALALFVDQESGGRGYIITGDPAFLQPYQQASKQLPAVLSDLQRQVASLPSASTQIDRVRTAHDTWLRSGIGPELAAAMAGHLKQAQTLVRTARAKVLFDALRHRVAAAQATLAQLDRSATSEVRTLTNRLTILVIVSLVLLALLVGVLWWTLHRDVLEPLRAVQRYARAVADGELNRPVAASGPPEFRALGHDVEGMRRQLVAEIDSAQAALEALEQRGPAVAALRHALTPTLISVPGAEVAGRLDPAEGVLAGDFYDTVELDGGRLGLLLGDVSGHGPVPAVFALQLKELLVAGLEAGRSPGEALSWAAHQHLVDVPDDQFATIFIAIIDVRAQAVSYANAGHPASLIIARSMGAGTPPRNGERPIRTTPSGLQVIELPATGPLLSPVVSTWSWSTMEHPFLAGDMLVAYTDGLVESRDDTGEQFGLDRLLNSLLAVDADELLDEVLSQVFARVREFSGGRAGDDTALLACRRAVADADVDRPLPSR